MLHLLPIRPILQAGTAIIVIAVLAAIYWGWIGQGDTVGDAITIFRWSIGFIITATVFLFGAWRWLKPLQRFIFPYLGGSWSGAIEFKGSKGPEYRDVHMKINHTLLGIKLLLESNESTSRTLVAYAEHDRDFNYYRLYYVYINERKEGKSGNVNYYRGLAILRVESDVKLELSGDYFTDTHRKGTLHLKRDIPHQWWKLWR